MKISIITVVRNAEKFIESCISSVLTQKYNELEYIIIDGKSEDQTIHLVNKYASKIHKIISEKDQGMYDAMNKGISLASGDVLGILNADDFYPSKTILSQIAQCFMETGADIVYGDLYYVDRQDADKIIRKWQSGEYKPGNFQWGWMPPHPTFYVKRELFEKYGNYKPEYGSAADYELMIRFLYKNQLKAAYLPEVIVKMRSGGISNSSLKNRIKASRADLAAMRVNGLPFPGLAILLKPLRKIPQFFQ
ncbi:MAG TPA: glycosyltransferase family 2 protein [Daejeonella sp.]|nr:glycosyltransferase family 2 protein [Daejeonella sp.]